MEIDILNTIGTGDIEIVGPAFIFKLLFVLLFAGYLGYAFMLTLRIRILQDTVKTGGSNIVRIVTYIHLLVALLGSLLGVILVLLG